MDKIFELIPVKNLYCIEIDDFVKEAAGDKTCRKGYQKIEEKGQCIYASDVLGYIYKDTKQEEGICWFDQTTNSSQYGAKDIPSNKEHLICIGD